MKLPQLHLRDLFWLVLVVGLSLVTVFVWRARRRLEFEYVKKNLEHIGLALKNDELRKAIEQEGYTVEETADGIALKKSD
jgi:hypothetical protein